MVDRVFARNNSYLILVPQTYMYPEVHKQIRSDIFRYQSSRRWRKEKVRDTKRFSIFLLQKR